jgi:4-amino-4-deoxy-L-arabinose transferase-like glycosyltransferase
MTQISDTIGWPDRKPAAGLNALGTDGACHIAMLALCSAVLIASVVLTPHADGLTLGGLHWPLHCWLHATFGIRCATCGMSRAFCALAHGDLAVSLGFHPLGPAAFFLCALQVPYRLYALAIRPRRVHRWLRRLHLGLALVLCAAIFIHWIIYLGGLLR